MYKYYVEGVFLVDLQVYCAMCNAQKHTSKRVFCLLLAMEFAARSGPLPARPGVSNTTASLGQNFSFHS